MAAHAFRTGPSPAPSIAADSRVRVGGSAADQKNAFLSVLSHLPRRHVQMLDSAVPRRLLPLIQASRVGCSCPSSPGSRRCSWARWLPAPGAALRAEGLSFTSVRCGRRSRRGHFTINQGVFCCPVAHSIRHPWWASLSGRAVNSV